MYIVSGFPPTREWQKRTFRFASTIYDLLVSEKTNIIESAIDTTTAMSFRFKRMVGWDGKHKMNGVNPVTPSLRSGHFHGHFVMNIHSSLGLHPEHSGYGVKKQFTLLYKTILKMSLRVKPSPTRRSEAVPLFIVCPCLN